MLRFPLRIPGGLRTSVRCTASVPGEEFALDDCSDGVCLIVKARTDNLTGLYG
jgi:hypothetical protein